MLQHSPVLVQHLLFFFLLLVAPVWDYSRTQRLKREATQERKIGYYRFLCIWLWIATAIAIAEVGWRPLFTFSVLPGEIDWLAHAWIRYLIEAVAALLAVALLLPLAIVFWKKIKKIPRKYASADALKSMSYFLPATWSERRWYAILSITAGICEELLFRGFLLRYLHVAPWTLSLTAALVVSAVIFGLQHLYLGAAGVMQATLMGMLFGLLFVITGNLLVPMLLHAVSDLRMLAIVRPPAERAAGAA